MSPDRWGLGMRLGKSKVGTLQIAKIFVNEELGKHTEVLNTNDNDSPFIHYLKCDHNGTTTMLFKFIVTISMTAHIAYTHHKYSTLFASY